MRSTWSGLGLLLVVPWLASCVSGPQVHLDTGQGSPLVYTPPADQPPPVELPQEEFLSSLTDLVLHLPLTVQAPDTEGRVRLVSWDADSRDMAPRIPLSLCAPSEPPDSCLVPPENAPPPETLARMRLALSFSMDTLWEGAAVPLSEYLDPLAFKIMVYTAMSTYLLLLMFPVPEPVTKGLAAVLTLYLVVYLGLGPVRAMAQAGWRLLEDSERATTAEELKEAGHRFGRVLGDNGLRVLLLLATAALGGKESFLGKAPGLPGFSRAALTSPTRTGVRLEAAGQVSSVALGVKELTVRLAPTAAASIAMGPGGGAPPRQGSPMEEEPPHRRWHEGSYGSPLESLHDHFARHGAEVGASDAAEYLRKAEAFAQNLRGAQRFPIEGFTEGVVRYVKSGRYIDLAPDGRIVSFGAR
jgi:hypothetical protein